MVAVKPIHHGRSGARDVRYTLWVPSLGTACGISEYTKHIAQETTPPTRITARPPRVAGVRVLHVQHEYALFGEGNLNDVTQAMRDAHVPVVVTEHSVIIAERPPGPIENPWERILFKARHEWEENADVLVALSEHGVQVLRARWPAKRIVHLPHGCPTWFPPRKSTRGRVIGAFGFLGPHKGFTDLLRVLREVPGTELLIYSHPKYTEYEEQWLESIRGLPVQWIREYLPEEEIATRLADRADVLTYWYREGPLASSSGAVRVGLATGVPVLTSQIDSFTELRDVTYQPEDLVDGVRRLLEDDELRRRLVSTAREYCQSNSWAASANRHVELWQELEATYRE